MLGGVDPIEAASVPIAIFASIFATGMISSSLLLRYSAGSFFTKGGSVKGRSGLAIKYYCIEDTGRLDLLPYSFTFPNIILQPLLVSILLYTCFEDFGL